MDKAGQTCRSCLTLNPVGAPACVRCNSPLADDQQSPAPSPWSNPPNSGPVQQLLPPPAPSPAPPVAPAPFPPMHPGPASYPPYQPQQGPPLHHGPSSGPHSQPQPGFQPGGAGALSGPLPSARRRRVLIVGNSIVLAGLIIGAAVLWFTRPHYLDTGAVARTIGNRIGATVHCPGKVHRGAGEQFTCTGTYDRGGDVRVRVTVRNGDGDYRWSVLPASGGR